MNENFGMMDQCYFTPKGEIIQWINNLLQINITKIESLGAGHVYCQILDSMDGNEKPIVPMSKVKFNAKLEYEFLSNLKILQTSFIKFGLKKHIEVEKLAKCKYQDNLEMIQWMKRLFDTNGGAKVDYDPVARRNGTEINLAFANKVVQPKVLNSKGQLVTAEQQQYMKKQEKILNKENNAQGTINSTIPKQSNVTTQKRASVTKEVPQQQQQVKKTSSLQQTNLQQQIASQAAMIENYEQQMVEKNNKLEKIKKVLLKLNISDTDKVEEISALLGMTSLMQVSSQQQQKLQQQEYLLQQQQEQHQQELLLQQQQQQQQHQLAMQQQMQEEMEQMRIQQELQQAQEIGEEDLMGNEEDDIM